MAAKVSGLQQKIVAEDEKWCLVIESIDQDGLSYRAMANAIKGIGKHCSMRTPLILYQIGRITYFQELLVLAKAMGNEYLSVSA